MSGALAEIVYTIVTKAPEGASSYVAWTVVVWRVRREPPVQAEEFAAQGRTSDTSRTAIILFSRGSAEGFSPLPGVTGGVPLDLNDFPRAGGWEEPRSCCTPWERRVRADAIRTQPETTRTFRCHFPLTSARRSCYNPPAPARTLTALSPRSTRRHPPPSTVNRPERRPTDSQEKTFLQTINRTAGQGVARTPLPTPLPPPPAGRTTAASGSGSAGRRRTGAAPT